MKPLELSNLDLKQLFLFKLLLKKLVSVTLIEFGEIRFNGPAFFPKSLYSMTSEPDIKFSFFLVSRARARFFFSISKLSKFMTTKHRIVDYRWFPPRLVEFDFFHDNPLKLLVALEKMKAKLDVFLPFFSFKTQVFANFKREFLFRRFENYEKFLQLKLYKQQHKSSAFSFLKHFDFLGLTFPTLKLYYNGWNSLFSFSPSLLFSSFICVLLRYKSSISFSTFLCSFFYIGALVFLFHSRSQTFYKEYSKKLYYDYYKNLPMPLARKLNPEKTINPRDRDAAKQFAWNFHYSHPEALPVIFIKSFSKFGRKRVIRYPVWKNLNRLTSFWWISKKMVEKNPPKILQTHRLFYNPKLPYTSRQFLMKIRFKLNTVSAK